MAKEKPTAAIDLKLSELIEKNFNLTDAFLTSLAEHCAVRLEDRGHSSGCEFGVDGAYKAMYKLEWSTVTEQMRRTCDDLTRATEFGAYAVAFLIVRQLTEFNVYRTSRQGTGFDFWLTRKSSTMFQDAARLEVSGIGQGDEVDVKKRCKEKLAQVKAVPSKLAAVIVVFEFGKPFLRIERYGNN